MGIGAVAVLFAVMVALASIVADGDAGDKNRQEWDESSMFGVLMGLGIVVVAAIPLSVGGVMLWHVRKKKRQEQLPL